MGITDTAGTERLTELLRRLLGDRQEYEAFEADPAAYLERHGLEEIGPEDVTSCMPAGYEPPATHLATDGTLEAPAGYADPPGWSPGAAAGTPMYEAIRQICYQRSYVEQEPDRYPGTSEAYDAPAAREAEGGDDGVRDTGEMSPDDDEPEVTAERAPMPDPGERVRVGDDPVPTGVGDREPPPREAADMTPPGVGATWEPDQPEAKDFRAELDPDLLDRAPPHSLGPEPGLGREVPEGVGPEPGAGREVPEAVETVAGIGREVPEAVEAVAGTGREVPAEEQRFGEGQEPSVEDILAERLAAAEEVRGPQPPPQEAREPREDAVAEQDALREPPAEVPDPGAGVDDDHLAERLAEADPHAAEPPPSDDGAEM